MPKRDGVAKQRPRAERGLWAQCVERMMAGGRNAPLTEAEGVALWRAIEKAVAIMPRTEWRKYAATSPRSRMADPRGGRLGADFLCSSSDRQGHVGARSLSREGRRRHS
jgi:hypothetical protein